MCIYVWCKQPNVNLHKKRKMLKKGALGGYSSHTIVDGGSYSFYSSKETYPRVAVAVRDHTVLCRFMPLSHTVVVHHY